MDSIRRLSVVSLLLAGGVSFAQEPTPPETAQVAQDRVESLEMQFALEPVELQISEELNLARDLYEEKDWQSTIDTLTPFLTKHLRHPRYGDALFLRAEALVQLQEYARAREDFEELLKTRPATTQVAHARFRIAEATMLLKEPERAKRLLQQFMSDFPQHRLNGYAIPYLAETAGRAGDIAWARDLYRASVRRFPNGPRNGDARYRLALLDYQLKDFGAAREGLANVIKSNSTDSASRQMAGYWLAMSEFQLGAYKSAHTRLLQFVDSHPDHELSPSAVYYAAQSLLNLKKPDGAAKLFTRVRADWPESEFAAVSAEAEMRTALAAGDHEEVLAIFGQLPSPTDSVAGLGDTAMQDAVRLAGESLIALERFDEANELIKPLVDARGSLLSQSAREQHHRNLFLLALTERGLGNHSKAAGMLRRIRLDMVGPKLAERVLLARIETLNATKEFSEAINEAFDYERRYRDGMYLSAVRTEMLRGMLEKGRVREANIKFRQLREANAAPEEIARAAQWMAESAYESEDYKSAIEAFRVLRANNQSDDELAQALSGLAWSHLKIGANRAAEQHFDELLEQFPEHASAPEARLARVQSMVESDDRKKAIEGLRFFVDKPRDYSSRAEALYQLAELYHRDKETLDQADKVIDEMISDYPEFKQRDAALYLSGMVRRALGDADAAERFSAVVDGHRGSKYWSDSLYRLAELASSEDRTNDARKYLTQLISSEPDRKVAPHALYMKGRIESDELDWQQARETLRRILRRYPESELIHVARYGIAESFFQEENFDRAMELFEILNREAEFGAGKAWGAMVQFRRAQLLVQRKDLVSAIAVAKRIERNFPDFSLQPEVDYLIARANASRGEFSAAREYYMKVSDAGSANYREIGAMARWMTGETYFHQKNYILAIKAYKVLVADDNFPSWQAASHLQIGKCYEKMDNLDMARKSYSRVVDRFAETESLEEAKYRLSILDKSS